MANRISHHDLVPATLLGRTSASLNMLPLARKNVLILVLGQESLSSLYRGPILLTDGSVQPYSLLMCDRFIVLSEGLDP